MHGLNSNIVYPPGSTVHFNPLVVKKPRKPGSNKTSTPPLDIDRVAHTAFASDSRHSSRSSSETSASAQTSRSSPCSTSSDNIRRSSTPSSVSQQTESETVTTPSAPHSFRSALMRVRRYSTSAFTSSGADRLTTNEPAAKSSNFTLKPSASADSLKSTSALDELGSINPDRLQAVNVVPPHVPPSGSVQGIQAPIGSVIRVHQDNWCSLMKLEEILKYKLDQPVTEQDDASPAKDGTPASNLSTNPFVEKPVEFKYKDLLQKIIDRDIRVIEALSLSCESLIPIEDLVSLIILELSNANRRPDELIQLLLFCARWINENRNTAWLTHAKERFEELLKIVQSHKLKNLSDYASRLHSILISEGIKTKEKWDSPFEKSNSRLERRLVTKNYEEIIAIAAEGQYTCEEFMNCAAKIVADILRYQIQLYRSLQSHDFILKKWAATPICLERMRLFQNGLSFLVVETILNREKLEERIRVICFWIEIAALLISQKDFASAKAIHLGLQNVSVSRLKQTWEGVRGTPAGFFQLSKIQELFSLDNNEMAYRNALTFLGKKRFIPALSVLEKDLESATHIDKTIVDDHGESIFNMHRILFIRECIQEVLSAQNNWDHELKNLRPCTNIVYKALEFGIADKNHHFDLSDIRYNRSRGLEGVDKALERTS